MPWTERHRSIMGDLYRIMQKFVDVPSPAAQDDVYWSLLAATLNEFSVKWGIDHLTVNAASFVCSWLQDMYKEKRDAAEKIEKAASQYRELADYGTAESKQEQCNIENNNSALRNDGKNGLVDANWNKSSSSYQNAVHQPKTQTTQHDAKQGGETEHGYIEPDPRICNGMLSFV